MMLENVAMLPVEDRAAFECAMLSIQNILAVTLTAECRVTLSDSKKERVLQTLADQFTCYQNI